MENSTNFYSYPFQGLKFTDNYFIYDKNIYNFNLNRNYIKNYYLRYISLLKNKPKKLNLKFTNTRSLLSDLVKKKIFLQE